MIKKWFIKTNENEIQNQGQNIILEQLDYSSEIHFYRKCLIFEIINNSFNYSKTYIVF